MKNAILLHGKPGEKEYYDPSFPSSSNYHWFPWLQKQLLIKDIKADTPEVPFAYDPQWELWVKEVERFDMSTQTTLIGHSCGGGFWVRYLSENKNLRVGKVVLVAPSFGYSGWGKKFFEGFSIDPEIASRVNSLTIFNSDNDDEGIQQAVREIREAIPQVNYREFHLGHFTHNDMKSAEFPELLEEVLR